MPSRRPLPLILAVIAVALAGCGSGGGSGYGPRDSTDTDTAASGGQETATATTPPAPPGAAARSCAGAAAGIKGLRVTGVECGVGRDVAAAWAAEPGCAAPPGESRFSCSVGGGYRCLGAVTETGIAVSCSHRGSSVAFVSEPR